MRGWVTRGNSRILGRQLGTGELQDCIPAVVAQPDDRILLMEQKVTNKEQDFKAMAAKPV